MKFRGCHAALSRAQARQRLLEAAVLLHRGFSHRDVDLLVKDALSAWTTGDALEPGVRS